MSDDHTRLNAYIDERARLVQRTLLLRGALTKQELWMSLAIKALTQKHPSPTQQMDALRLAQQGRELLHEVRADERATSIEGGGAPLGEAATAPPPSVQGY